MRKFLSIFKRIFRPQGPPFKEKQLVYASIARCQCGAGLAYVPGSSMNYWDCSHILTGKAIPAGQPGSCRHTDRLPFAFWEIKSELQPSQNGLTTRLPQ